MGALIALGSDSDVDMDKASQGSAGQGLRCRILVLSFAI